MLAVLIAGNDKDKFDTLSNTLIETDEVEIAWTGSGGSVLELIQVKAFDMVVADERLGDMTGLELAGRMLHVNPMINTAVVTGLSEDDFHEASEGLGVLMGLTSKPGREESLALFEKLKRIKGLSVNPM